MSLRLLVVRSIRGPPNPSWLLGHQHVLRHASNVGDYEKKWYREYGAVYRLAGVFSEPILSFSDPKAIQYILHTSGYCFPKSADSDNLFDVLFGPEIGSAPGKTILITTDNTFLQAPSINISEES
ncbi:hypothetical protein CPB85DRAFT_1305126 [Mucidula mucida]|nr:hypothetical protein CPB85DRAFT_1305126 [Mucidula mucida]